MTFADAWSDALPCSHREALHTSLSILVDHFFEELPQVVSGQMDFSESTLGSLLPQKYMPRYTPLFQKRFFICLLSVAWKLAQGKPAMPLLSCTAEELALRALIGQAEVVLDMQGVQADFGDFEDVAFQDLDHEVLFHMAMDGIEDSEAGDKLGMVYLHFDEWFVPFENAATALHPYAAD